jgi:transcriptional regulator GlxA family with amidase domain
MPNAAIPVWILVFDDFLLLDATGPAQVFSTANDEARDAGRAEPYRLRMVSRRGGAVMSTSGVALLTQRLPRIDAMGEGATLIVAGGRGCDGEAIDAATLHWLARAAAKVRRCCAVCTGAFLLARAGLLDGRRAATHWQDAAELQRRYPAVRVEDDAIHVKDGKFYTSAGISAGIDLCLALAGEDGGEAFARGVARRLVVFLKRPGGQRQFGTAPPEQAEEAEDAGVAARLRRWLAPRLAQQVGVDAMADACALSLRSLHRKLRGEAGTTPAKLLASLRMEAACRLLEAGNMPLKQVARRSGFGSEYNLRRAFALHLGVLPSDYRARFA